MSANPAKRGSSTLLARKSVMVRDDDLAEQLKTHLQLDDVEVVAGAEADTENREALARAAAAYLRRTVLPGDTFGFSWGRTLASIGGYMELLPDSTLVALTGSVGTDFEQSPVDVIRRVAGRSQVRTMTIFAPMFVDSASTAAGLRKDPAISSVLASYADLDLAVLSIGSWDPPITQLMQSLSSEDRRQLDEAKVRAEVVGIFIRDDGRPFDAPVVQRRISISAEQLIQVPQVLAVAGGTEKVLALAAVARSRLITSLITDERTARQLLAQEAVAEGPGRYPADPPFRRAV
ncbi:MULTISPECIES: sugar-binding transcriptional regulator [unclassified Luteococcus]|uniref:sugar-binding transcriptional regulator n=1 Tax=unclassified Luteococcus TaxID=2639923 RepID=UPI00313DCE61